MSSSEVDRRINAIVAPVATQLETLIHSVRELSERSLKGSTEGIAASERLRSSGQRSDKCSAIKNVFLVESFDMLEEKTRDVKVVTVPLLGNCTTGGSV